MERGASLSMYGMMCGIMELGRGVRKTLCDVVLSNDTHFIP